MMKKMMLLIAILVFAASVGCAADQLNRNPLSNLTDGQSDWFDRTSEGWRFE